MIELRPHHGMCIGQFSGHGYNGEFTENMKQVITRLEESQDQIIKLVCHTDIICSKCPYNETGNCQSGQNVLSYDKYCLKFCGLKENQEISWAAFKKKVKESIIEKDQLGKICTNCSWIDLCLQDLGRNY
ncbi:MAG: DUF1284 domain-containing protein [Anaerovoracaceae bacterium]|jgi:hypothetical protein